MKKRTFCLIICSIFLPCFISCEWLSGSSEFNNKERLEDIIGMNLPNYKVVQYIPNDLTWQGEFLDSAMIEFDEILPRAFFDSIDSYISGDSSATKSRWTRKDEHNYAYSAWVDDGGRVPECRKGKTDWWVVVQLSDTSKRALVISCHY